MTSELETLRRALDTMPAKDRAVFERARFRDLDYDAIAAELDISVAEVERRLADAMLHLMRT